MTSNRSTNGTRSQEVYNLLEQALKQPGVREAVQVYEKWRTVERVNQVHRQAVNVQRSGWASNSSHC